MPQLDKFSFSSQVLWLVVVFFFLYFVLVQIGLPRLYKVLYFRKKKLLNLNKGSVNFIMEVFFFYNSFNYFSSVFLAKLRASSEVFSLLPKEVLSSQYDNYKSLNEKIQKVYSVPGSADSIKNIFDTNYFLRSHFNSSKKI